MLLAGPCTVADKLDELDVVRIRLDSDDDIGKDGRTIYGIFHGSLILPSKQFGPANLLETPHLAQK
jgi:hypothetical protein